MRFLFVNRFADNDQVPTARMLQDVARILAAGGHRVIILASRGDYAGKSAGWSIPDGVTIRRVWTPRRRALAWPVFWLQVLLRMPCLSWDVGVLMTDPPFLTPLARLIRAIHGTRRKIYWWTMDLYPESLIAAGLIPDNGWLTRRLLGLNRWGARGLSGIICLGERQRERLQYCLTAQPGLPVINIPPWDDRPIQHVPGESNKFLQELSSGLPCRIALYAGNLGRGHSFADLLDAARLLDGKNSPWLFVFVCRGASRPLLEKAATGLANVRIMDYLPASRTGELLWSATVHLITMAEGWDGVVVPSKLYGALQTDAPILFIGPERADTAMEIQRYERGMVLPNGCGGKRVVAALDVLSKETESCPKVKINPAAEIAKFLQGTTRALDADKRLA
ncbi:MAG: glycosyltransferase [Kiritimatiellia bacterium]